MPDLDVEKMEYTYLTQIFKEGVTEDRVVRTLIQGNRQKVYYELQVVPVRDENGHLMGIYSTGRDMTEVANSYQQQQENLLQQEKANEEVTTYINNINYVLKVGGVRMMNYYPSTHQLTIYSEIGHVEYEITQQRVFHLTHECDKQMVSRIIMNMDNRSITPSEILFRYVS